jgi:hypothetical protein
MILNQLIITPSTLTACMDRDAFALTIVAQRWNMQEALSHEALERSTPLI